MRYAVPLSVVACLFVWAGQPASAEENWLSQCVRQENATSLTDAQCHADYSLRLKDEQAAIVRRIASLLSKPGPEGTDYASASRLLTAAQAQWLGYVEADCNIVDAVFGRGTAFGMAEESCVIERYEQRNRELMDLENSYLDR